MRLLRHRGAVLRARARIGPPLAVRLDAHGVAQQTRPSGHIVRLAQPLRGLIPMLLDASTLPPIGHRRRSERSCTASRLFECPHITAAERSYSKTLLEGQADLGHARDREHRPRGRRAAELDDHRGRLGLRDAERPAVGLHARDVRLRRLGRRQPERVGGLQHRGDRRQPGALTGVLCLASNDAGEALITIPVSLAIRSLRAEIAAVRAALAAHSPLPSTHANRALIAALAALDRALEAGNWDDGVRPDEAGGRNVFDALIRAVKELNKIGEPWSAVRGRLARRNGPGDCGRCDRRGTRGAEQGQRAQGAAARRREGQRRAEARVVSPRLGLGP